MRSRLHRFLQGVKVVDLSRYLPGPLATLMLSDLGAAVIKVESPQGDGIETLGPLRADGRSAWHEAINGGKEIVRLDLKQAEDKDALWQLLDDADIVLESFRPGVLAKIGFATAEMRRRNPRIIIASLSGYGQQGPLSQAAGHDINYLATAGFLSDVGADRYTPALVSPPVADTFGSMFALASILAALYERERSGEGCYIDLALADAVTPILTFALSEVGGPRSRAARAEDFLSGGWACYGVYLCADGQEVALGAIEPKFWAAFCEAAGHPEWALRQQEPLPQRALKAEVAAFFRSQPLEAVLAQFAQVDCCLSPVLDIPSAAETAHAKAREVVQRGADGSLQAVFPVWVDGLPPSARSPLRHIAHKAKEQGHGS
nr:Acetyl-CoA:oxalate CoA-transferase [Cupriavidus sp.]